MCLSPNELQLFVRVGVGRSTPGWLKRERETREEAGCGLLEVEGMLIGGRARGSERGREARDAPS